MQFWHSQTIKKSVVANVYEEQISQSTGGTEAFNQSCPQPEARTQSMTSFNSDRRAFLAGTGAAVLTAMAGCSAFADGRGVPGNAEPVDDEEDEDDRDERIPQAVHDHLEEQEARGYEGELPDMTGEESISVTVGAGGAGLAYDPVIAHIDPGTEVTFEWTGSGGAHNVESTGPTDKEFTSGDPVDSGDETWTYTFEEEGSMVYHCTPHTGTGMHAALLVGELEGGPDPVESYMEENEANLWEGEIVDATDEDAISIENGAGGAGLAFDPPAVRVESGTEVTWEWTGEGGAHNVESTDAPEEFTSGEAVDSGDETWTHTFEAAGNHFYHCAPHTGTGMHGVVVVEGDEETEGEENGNGDTENGNGDTENGNGDTENGNGDTENGNGDTDNSE